MANRFHKAGRCGTAAHTATARYSRRSLVSTVHGEQPAAVRPAIQSGQPRWIGADETAELDGGWRARTREQNMSHAHPLQVGPVLGGRGLNEITPVVTLEIEWYRLAPGIEPHERLVVAGNDRRRRQIRDNRQQLGKVRGDGDRKSTRLNSSHVRISYAVFC